MVSQTVYFTGMMISTLTSRCTIAYQYSCEYSYEYLPMSICTSMSTITLELANRSKLRVPEIQYLSTQGFYSSEPTKNKTFLRPF